MNPYSDVTMDQIKAEVAEHFGISARTLHSRRRSRIVVRPRQVAMYLAQQLTVRSMADIGRCFKVDHTTVIHACKQIPDLMGHDERLRASVELLQTKLEAETPAEEEQLSSEIHRELRTRIVKLSSYLLNEARRDPAGMLNALEELAEKRRGVNGNEVHRA